MPVPILPPRPLDDGRMAELDALIRGDHRRKLLRHGTRYGYTGWCCRCRQCRLAHRRACREWAARNAAHRKRYERDRYLRKLADGGAKGKEVGQ